jgi:hypothetical protein
MLSQIRACVKQLAISWQKHSLQRMFERGIHRQEVIAAILNGKIIEEYFDDYPLPSILIADVLCKRPLHVVVSYDATSSKCYIITAYEPDTKHFENDLITRKEDEK